MNGHQRTRFLYQCIQGLGGHLPRPPIIISSHSQERRYQQCAHNKRIHKNPEDRLGSKNGISDTKKHKYSPRTQLGILNWSYVKRMQFKYDNQEFMKFNFLTDITVSHFSPEHQKFFTIDIQEECGEETNQERSQIPKKQRSKSQQRILCGSNSEICADYYQYGPDILGVGISRVTTFH